MALAVLLAPWPRAGFGRFSRPGAAGRRCCILRVAPDEARRERVLESLDELSGSLGALSDAIHKVMSSVRRLADVIRDEESVPGVDEPAVQETDAVAQLRERNALAHQIAFRLQQSFLQSRIEGLGKPFELAVEDFVTTCMQARENGIGMHELQLQLVLADGALTGPFSISSERASFVIGEEARIRAAWVRYVYVTLTEVDNIQNEVVDLTAQAGRKEAVDSSDLFVKQVVKMATDEGYNLDKLKLEQGFSGPAASPSIRTLRESSFLILFTFERAMSRR